MKKNKNFSTLREAFNIAKSKTPRKKWNWMNCGTEREWTLNENLNSFKKYKINQRILNDVSKINTNVKFLGVKLKIPLMISPPHRILEKSSLTRNDDFSSFKKLLR